MAFMGTLAAISIGMPLMAQAQATKVTAPAFGLIGDDGAERMALTTGPGVKSVLNVFDTTGTSRIGIQTGGQLGTLPSSEAMTLVAANGATVAQFGSGTDPDQVHLRLSDQDGHVRARVVVQLDGTPAIELLDADGSVTWSAP
jgi:hypothetical protein